jgi:hypothetical protein
MAQPERGRLRWHVRPSDVLSRRVGTVRTTV